MILPTSINYNITIPSQTNFKIKKKIIATNTQLYTVMNYDKHMLCKTDVSNGLYRSLIFSYPQNLVLSFSPPKTVDFTDFIKKYPNVTDNIIINQCIEGVMIQLFFDYRSQCWEIATKGNVGGKYYISGKKTDTSPPTFYEMFLDSLCVTTLSGSFFDSLQKDMAYTFILQHPKNIIILPGEQRQKLYLIAVYKMLLENLIEYIPSSIYENWSEFQNINNIVVFPRRYNVLKYSDLIDIHCKDRGFVITNIETGERAVLESEFYNQLKTIQSITPHVQYQYLCLRRINKVTDYLSIYPFFAKQFYKIREHYEEFLSNVYRSYMNFYVYKNTKQVLEKYWKHVKKIHHTIYLPNIKTAIVSRKTIHEYFNKMEPNQLLYILNGDNREPTQL